MELVSQKVSVQKAETSKIGQVDFDNLAFGDIFTDHMLVCDYKNGAWQTPEIVPYQNLEIAPSARVFHYGQAIFEGMKYFNS